MKPKQIVKTFGVPMITVKRYMKLYREHWIQGFYEAKPRRPRIPIRPHWSRCSPRGPSQGRPCHPRSNPPPLGNGNGTFQAAVNYGTGSFPYSLAVGDFNGDGTLRLQNYERPQVCPVTVEHVPIVYQPSLAE